MNKNINVDLFRRFSASNKVEMVNALTKDELLSVTEQTITRIVKEVGSNYLKSRDKKMYIKSELRCGNNWNSEIDYLDYIKGKVYVNVYIQNGDTDTDKGELLSVFLKRGDFNTKAYFTNRYGDDIPTYVTYTPDDRPRLSNPFCCITYIPSMPTNSRQTSDKAKPNPFMGFGYPNHLIIHQKRQSYANPMVFQCIYKR